MPLFALVYSGAVVFSAIDPVWATPINTVLLLAIALIGYLSNRRVSRVETKADNIQAKADAIHQDVGNAASAAASAANAAADSARITKEIGGAIRHIGDPSVQPPTEP